MPRRLMLWGRLRGDKTYWFLNIGVGNTHFARRRDPVRCGTRRGTSTKLVAQSTSYSKCFGTKYVQTYFALSQPSRGTARRRTPRRAAPPPRRACMLFQFSSSLSFLFWAFLSPCWRQSTQDFNSFQNFKTGPLSLSYEGPPNR